MFTRDSIRYRIQRLTVLTTGVALAIACSVFIFFEWRSFLGMEKQAALSTGRIAADASSGMLAFSNKVEALKLLAAFHAESDVRAAALYSASGGLFAEYRASREEPPVPRSPQADGLYTGKRTLQLFHPVIEGDVRYGTLYLRTDLRDMYWRLSRYGLIALLVFGAALAGSNIVGQLLQQTVSHPILSLAKTAQSISQERNYSVRADEHVGGEIGVLTNAFNEMVETIQQQRIQLDQDFAEQKEASRRLAESEQRLQVAMAAARMGAWEWNIATGRIIWSSGLEEIHGLEAGTFGGTIEDFKRDIHPGDVAAVLESIQQALASKQDYHVLYRVILPDGTLRWLEAFGKLALGADGQPVKLAGVCMDVTERKHAEAALAESHTLLSTAMEAVPAAIWIARDPQCKMIIGNRASSEFLRLPPQTNASLSAPDAERPMNFQVLHSGRVLQPDELPVQRAARGEEVRDMEEEIRYRDGTSRYLLGNATPLRDPQGNLWGAVAAFVDITERKRAEAALRESEQQLREAQRKLLLHAADLEATVADRTGKLRETVHELQTLSYSIAHDMRAPLRAMGTFAQLLLEDSSAAHLSSSGQDYLRRILVAASRLDKLIHDALNYNKAVLQEPPPLVPVDLSRLLHGIIDTYPNLHPDTADIHLNGDLPKVLGNEAFLTQCFSNLLGNAVKFVAPGTRPSVKIWADRVDESARIWVQDNGVGIHPQAHGRLFGMFQKLDSQYEGTGIGLAIVRKVVEKMGGKVGVESEPGRGSRFWVELRVARDDSNV